MPDDDKVIKTDDVEPTPEPNDDDAPKEEQRVPYDRFAQVNREKQELAERLAQLEQAEKERQQAEMSDVERLTAQLAESEKRANEAAELATFLEKESWVRGAAKQFIDPEDAIVHLDLDSLEDEEAVEAAVNALAEEKPHLVRGGDDEPAKPSAIGSLLGRPANGEPTDDDEGRTEVAKGLAAILARRN